LTGYYTQYDNYNATASNVNGGDIAEWHMAQWHELTTAANIAASPNSASATGYFGSWNTLITPLTSVKDALPTGSGGLGVQWNAQSIEYNPVNNGPAPSFWEYDPKNASDGATGAAAGVPLTNAHGILIQPDIWAPTGGFGGSGLFAYGCAPSPELNKRTTSTGVAHRPTSTFGAYQNGWESCYHVGNNAVWQGGHAIYLGGRTGKKPDGTADSTKTGAAILAKYAWGPALIDASQATYSQAFALLGAGPTQGVYWNGAAEGIYGDSSGNLHAIGPMIFGSAETAPAHIAGGAAPISSGSCAIKMQVGGNTAGSFKANGACAAGTIILTFATKAPNGWACSASDLTTPADTIKQTAFSASATTFTATMAASDLATFSCTAF
jgi:hypothetical protein